MKEELLHLLRYHKWANLTLLNRMKELPIEAFTKELGGTFPSISATFQHIYDVDQQWFKRINPDTKTVPLHAMEVEGTKNYFLELHETMTNFIDNHYENLLEVYYVNSKGEQFQNSIDEIFRHLTNHGTYHRGNISTMIRLQGYEGVSTDYIYYLRVNR